MVVVLDAHTMRSAHPEPSDGLNINLYALKHKLFSFFQLTAICAGGFDREAV